MIVFLPYEDFKKSVRVLDNKRLWKQILECKQILNALRSGVKSRLTAHPGVKCWSGYEDLLTCYFNEALFEWKHRGYKSSLDDLSKEDGYIPSGRDQYILDNPGWLGDPYYHRAMRSRLLSKNPDYYRKFFMDDKGYNSGQYWYPVVDLNRPYEVNFYRQSDKLLLYRDGVIPQAGKEYVRVSNFNGRRNRVLFEDERFYRVIGTSEEDQILSEDYSDHTFRTSNGQFQFFHIDDKSIFYKK